MALRTLQTTNARITAKPVNGQKSSLDDILQAIGSVEEISQIEQDKQILQHNEQLQKDEIADEARVQKAVFDGKDLSNLEVKTKKGLVSRDTEYSRITNKENLEEARLEGAKAGKSLREIEEDFKLKSQNDIALAGTPEQKAAMIDKANATSNMLSNNAAEQEIARAAAEKRSVDTNAVILSLDAQMPDSSFNPEQKKMWYELNAKRDINTIVNQSMVLAESNGWNADEHETYLKNQIAKFSLKNGNNISYVNKINEDGLNKIESLRSSYVAKSVKKAADDNFNDSQAMSKTFIEDSDFQSLEQSLAIGKASEQSVKAAIVNNLVRYNDPTNPQPIPEDLVQWLEADRPNGTSGWAFSDGTIRNLLNANKSDIASIKAKALKKQLEDSIYKPTAEEISLYNDELDKRTAEGSLTMDFIMEGERKNILSTKVQVAKQISALREQNKQADLDTSFNESLVYNSGDFSNIISSNDNDKIQVSANRAFKRIASASTGKTYGNADFVSAEDVQTTFNNPEGRALIFNMVENGVVPDDFKKGFQSNPYTDMEAFTNEATIYETMTNKINARGYTDDKLKDVFRTLVGKEQADSYELYADIKRSFPNADENEVKQMLSLGVNASSQYSTNIMQDTGITRKDFEDIADKGVKDIGGAGLFNLADIDIDGIENQLKNAYKKEMNRVYATQSKHMTTDEVISRVNQRVLNNYTRIGDTLVRKDYLTNGPKAANYENEEYFERYKQQQAFNYLGDASRSDEIVIMPGNQTDKTDLYEIRTNSGSLLGLTYMMKDSKGDHQSFKSYTDAYAAYKYESESYKDKLVDLEGYTTARGDITKITTEEERKEAKVVRAKLKELEDANSINVKGYKEVEVVSRLINNTAIKPLQSKAELEGGYYTVNGKKVYDVSKLNMKDKQELMSTTVKRARQKFERFEKFKGLSIKQQNRMAEMFILESSKLENADIPSSELVKTVFDARMESINQIADISVDFTREIGNKDVNAILSDSGYVLLDKVAYGFKTGINIIKLQSKLKALTDAED